MLVWLNGRFVDARRARVSALDRGLLHGDGLYDTWRTYDGTPFDTAAHLRRLAVSAKRLGFPHPGAARLWAGEYSQALRVYLDASRSTATGYRLYLFYPS